MPNKTTQTGFAPINGAQLYYEVAGSGMPLVMIHAGVADHRQWQDEFNHFAGSFRVVRYDQRRFGRSEPVAGEFSYLADLTALIDHLKLAGPLVLMGCSMGGGLAIDYALAHPGRVAGLILVGSGPSGLELDVPTPKLFAMAEAAYEAGDLDRVAEIETQIWFDGPTRTAGQVDPAQRALAYEMNRTALAHEATGIGERVAGTAEPSAGRLGELTMPVQIIIGAHDIPYLRAAADYMLTHLPDVRLATIADGAHLPNMDQPAEFRQIVSTFLQNIGML